MSDTRRSRQIELFDSYSEGVDAALHQIPESECPQPGPGFYRDAWMLGYARTVEALEHPDALELPTVRPGHFRHIHREALRPCPHCREQGPGPADKTHTDEIRFREFRFRLVAICRGGVDLKIEQRNLADSCWNVERGDIVTWFPNLDEARCFLKQLGAGL